MIEIVAYTRPEPQGSAKAFVRNGRAIITSANTKLKPYRSEVTRCAMAELAEQGFQIPAFARHWPLMLDIEFCLLRPESVSKKRNFPVVKPDLDKLLRATLDALTGVLFHDDAQVVEVTTRKIYGGIEGVKITASTREAA